MRVIKHAVISFGMTAIPVGIAGTKTGTNEPEFRTIRKECGHPIGLQKRCLECDEMAEETLKGYEVTKGQFVTFTEEELLSVGSDRDTTIELSKFVRASDIQETMIDKIYWLSQPENPKLAEKYGLLFQVLAETRKAGIGKESLWGKECPCAVVASTHHPALQLIVLNQAEDLLVPDFIPAVPDRDAKSMAKQILDSMTEDFDPTTDLVSSSRARTQDLISARIEGSDLPNFGEPTPAQADSDLMESLRAEVERIEKAKKKPTKPTRKRTTTKK